MKQLKLLAALTGVALALAPGGKALAQAQGPGGMDPQQMQTMLQQFQNMLQSFQNMDPQQMQNAMRQRVTNSLREQMGVTNDADWSVIEEKINAVTKARAAVMADGGGMPGLGGLRGGFGGGRGGGMQAT